MSDLAQRYQQRLDSLRTDRSNFESQWEEAAQYVSPADRTLFSGQGKSQTTAGYQGQKKTDLQFDSTASLAAGNFSTVMESICTPKGSKWHTVTAMDKSLAKNRRVREYFELLRDTLFRYRYAAGSGFVTNIQQCYLQLGVYGNGTLYTDAPEKGKGLRYRAIHLAEAYYVNNHQNLVDSLFRPFSLEARQAVQKFGAKAVPPDILSAANDPMRANQKKQYLHVVHPQEDFVPGAIGPRGRRFASFYLSLDPLGMVIPGGYRTFPYQIMRYTQFSGEDYGRGPAQWVLAAIKLLNQEKKANIKQGHRAADPILLANNDGILDGFVMRSGYLNKGGISPDGKRMVDVLPTGNFAISEKLMEMERTVIHDAFLISLFQILVDNPQMTATEVLERMKEKGMLLAPKAGRVEEEFLGPLIEREIDVLGAQGLLPPPPSILQDALGEVEYAIEYDSPLSRMRRAEGAAGFFRTISQLGEIAKATGDLSVMDYASFDRATPALFDINGAPIDWTATEDEVAAKRDARQKANDMQQLSQAAPGIAALAQAMPDAAKAQAPATP